MGFGRDTGDLPIMKRSEMTLNRRRWFPRTAECPVWTGSAGGFSSPGDTTARSLSRLLALVGVGAAMIHFWWPGETGAIAWRVAGRRIRSAGTGIGEA